MEKPNFDKITAEDLKENSRLSLLYLEAVKRGFWPNTVSSVLDFWGMAEKAMIEDKNNTPGKLFYSLIKNKNKKYITNVMEQRAIQRMNSDHRQALVDEAQKIKTRPISTNEETQNLLFGNDQSNVGYQHSIMLQCFLPQKELPLEQREYEVSHGRAKLLIEAGRVADPKRPGEWQKCGLPYGSRSRLIIPYINAYAIMRKTRKINLGESLRRFLDNIGAGINDYNRKAVTKQIQSLSSCQFVFGEWQQEYSKTKYGRLADEVFFWVDRDVRQGLLWHQHIILSEGYYGALKSRHVPINMDHMVKLGRSERRMDLYSWLSYRLPGISENKAIHIPLYSLMEIFAPNISSRKLFKQRFQGDLKAIGKIYPCFNIEIQGDLLTLRKSPSPISNKKFYALSK